MRKPLTDQVAAVVLAAGKGTRMRSSVPKVLHPIGGRPMIGHLLETLHRLGIDRTVVVVGPDMDDFSSHFPDTETVVQEQALGTGHAVQCAAGALKGFSGTVLVLFGADPLVTEATLRRLIEARSGEHAPAFVVLGFQPDDPGQYGRLVVDEGGTLRRIVEFWDATDDQRRISLCNSGVLAADAGHLFDLVAALGDDNAKAEYYLTDIIALGADKGLTSTVVEGAPSELIGVDSRADLARAEAEFQKRARLEAMANGVTLSDPDSVWFSYDTEIGEDVFLEPHVVFGPGVRIESGVTIRSFSHLEGCFVESNAVVGPFARLRPGARVGMNAKVGNFVEIKNAELHEGAKVNHLTYIGDASVGAGANIGAGTITANYDGYRKSRTEIGADAAIGSNVVLVAPVSIGAGATVGAGTVVRSDVPKDALRVADTRGIEATRSDWSKVKRQRAKES